MPRPYLYQQAKALREDLGLTQAEAGAKLSPAQAQSYVSQLEQGNRRDGERQYLQMLKGIAERPRNGGVRPRTSPRSELRLT